MQPRRVHMVDSSQKHATLARTVVVRQSPRQEREDPSIDRYRSSSSSSSCLLYQSRC